MKPSIHALILLASAALAGCGHGGGQAGSGSSAKTERGAPRSENATAAEVAREARGSVDCPAQVKTAVDPKQPVTDIIGVRPGLSYEEAANLVLCTNELMVVQPDSRGFRINTYGQTLRQGFDGTIAKPRIAKTSKQIMQEMQDDALARGGNRVQEDMAPGQSKWYVGTIGLPGHERVINAAREEWFEEGRNPTRASVGQALVKKYGTPTRNPPSSSTQTNITWAYDPLGRLISETSPLYNRCTGVADPDGGANFSPDCGLVVAAVIVGKPDNPDLARFLQVGVVDQAGGYAAITQTEQALMAQDSQRKAEQVKAASKNADAPKL